jgi:MFS transporter, DHA1 family, inner membrane transport protein
MQKQANYERKTSSSAQSMLMFVVLLASYSINAMDRQIFPLVAADVRKEYGFSLAGAGLLSTIFTLGMAISGLPTGYLLTRFPRRKVLQFGIAVFSATTALTAISRGFADMFLYRALTGVGEAMQFTTLLAITAAFFVRYRSTSVGAVNVFFGLGAIVGPTFGARLLAQYGSWRAPVTIFGLLGFLAIAVVAIAVKPWFSEAKAGQEVRAHSGGEQSLGNPNTVILTLLSLIAGLIMYGYLGMYPTFLREQLRFSPKDAGLVMSMYGFGGLTSMAGGWLGDHFSPRAVLSAAFLGVAGLGYALFHGAHSFHAEAALSFLWAFLASGTIYVNLGSYHLQAVHGPLASKASGVFVTSFYLSATVAGYTFGWIANRAGWLAAGVMQLTALGVVGACLAVALRPNAMRAADSADSYGPRAEPAPTG